MRFNKALAAAAVVVLGTTGVAATAQAGPLPNIIVGTSARDVLIGTRHQDIILGLGSRDQLLGGPGADRLRGGRGNDVIRDWRSHLGSDVLVGFTGDDTCIGNATDTFRGCETIIIRRG